MINIIDKGVRKILRENKDKLKASKTKQAEASFLPR